MEMKGNYHTTDLYIVIWLSSNGLELLDIDRHNSQRLDFIFQDRLHNTVLEIKEQG